ncbi:MAG: hypothetical protein LAT54_08795 [Cryomorphaceae bacterium]|nr:hypothetical protein [Cryomorphaceae bacterium]
MKHLYLITLFVVTWSISAQEPVWHENIQTLDAAHAYYDSLRNSGHTMKGIDYPNFMRYYYANIQHWANDGSIENTRNATRLLNESKKLQLTIEPPMGNAHGTSSAIV